MNLDKDAYYKLVKTYKTEEEYLTDHEYIKKGMILDDLDDWLRSCTKYQDINDFLNIETNDKLMIQSFQSVVIGVLEKVRSKIVELSEE